MSRSFLKTFDACVVNIKDEFEKNPKKNSNWYNITKYFVLETNYDYFYTIFHTFLSLIQDVHGEKIKFSILIFGQTHNKTKMKLPYQMII
jgi:hypothetical protein